MADDIGNKLEIYFTKCDDYIDKIVKVKDNDLHFKKVFKDNKGTIVNVHIEYGILFAIVDWEKPVDFFTYEEIINNVKYKNIYAIPLDKLEFIDDVEVKKVEPILNIGANGVEINFEPINDDIYFTKLDLNGNILEKNTVISKKEALIENKEKGDNIMENIDELIKLYYNEKVEEFRENERNEIREIKKNDKIQELIEEFKLNLCQYNDCDIEDINIGIYGTIEITEESLDKIDNIKTETNKKIDELKLTCDKAKALLKMAETYEQKIEILIDYNILDKKTKRLK